MASSRSELNTALGGLGASPSAVLTSLSLQQSRVTPHTGQREVGAAAAAAAGGFGAAAAATSAGSSSGTFLPPSPLMGTTPELLGCSPASLSHGLMGTSLPRRETPHTALRLQTTVAQQLQLQRPDSSNAVGSKEPTSSAARSGAGAGTAPGDGATAVRTSLHREQRSNKSNSGAAEGRHATASGAGVPPPDNFGPFSSATAGGAAARQPLAFGVSPGSTSAMVAGLSRSLPSPGVVPTAASFISPTSASSSAFNPSGCTGPSTMNTNMLLSSSPFGADGRRRRAVGLTLGSSAGSMEFSPSGKPQHLDVEDREGMLSGLDRASSGPVGGSTPLTLGGSVGSAGITRFTPHVHFREEAAIILAGSEQAASVNDDSDSNAAGSPGSGASGQVQRCTFAGGASSPASKTSDGESTAAAFGAVRASRPVPLPRRGVELFTARQEDPQTAAVRASRPATTGPSFRIPSLLGKSAPNFQSSGSGRSFLLDTADDNADDASTKSLRISLFGAGAQAASGGAFVVPPLATSVPAFCRVRAMNPTTTNSSSAGQEGSSAADGSAEMGVSPSRRPTLHTMLREVEYGDYAAPPADGGSRAMTMAALADHRAEREAQYSYQGGEYAS